MRVLLVMTLLVLQLTVAGASSQDDQRLLSLLINNLQEAVRETRGVEEVQDASHERTNRLLDTLPKAQQKKKARDASQQRTSRLLDHLLKERREAEEEEKRHLVTAHDASKGRTSRLLDTLLKERRQEVEEEERKLVARVLDRLLERRGGPIDDEAAISQAYQSVRSDDNAVMWCVLKYDGKKIVLDSVGADYGEWLSKFQDDERAYSYVRVEVGDDMSRRAKFAFVTWIGPGVSPLKKARVSTDKAFVKQLMPMFGKEILSDEINELKIEKIRQVLENASGSAYGTGQ